MQETMEYHIKGESCDTSEATTHTLCISVLDYRRQELPSTFNWSVSNGPHKPSWMAAYLVHAPKTRTQT